MQTAGTTCWICIYVHRERARASQAAPAPAVFHPCQSIRQLDSTASEKSRKNPTLTSCWAKKKKSPQHVNGVSCGNWLSYLQCHCFICQQWEADKPWRWLSWEQPQHPWLLLSFPGKATPSPASVSQLNKGDQHNAASHMRVLRGKMSLLHCQWTSFHLSSVCKITLFSFSC